MKLGFFTACLPSWTLEQVADYAVAQGYQCLEVAAWPAQPGRDFEAPHLPVATWSGADVDATLGLLERTGLEISSLGYYENNLIGDLGRREEIRTHVKACIDVAQSLAVPSVGTFIGRDPAKSVVENMAEAERVFPELVDYAGERGVKLMIENCVMEGWHPDGYPGNIAYSPELWEWMTTELGLYLNWDPSHLAWIGIDPVETILPFAASIVHVQAKDVETVPGPAQPVRLLRGGGEGRQPLAHRLVALPGAGTRQRRLAAGCRPAVRGRLHRHRVRRARGPDVGRHSGEGGRGAADRLRHAASADRRRQHLSRRGPVSRGPCGQLPRRGLRGPRPPR